MAAAAALVSGGLDSLIRRQTAASFAGHSSASPLASQSPIGKNSSAGEMFEADERKPIKRVITQEEVDQVRQLPDLMDRIAGMGLTEEYLSYRERYLGWRQGKHQGASGELRGDRLEAKRGGFGYWYPSVEVWQWRRTLSYWISVTFFEGSLFFTFSSFLWMFPDRLGALKRSVTIWGYVAGKVNFLVCCYLMCIETINLSGEGHGSRKHSVAASDESDDGMDDASSVSSEDSDRSVGGEKDWYFWPFHFNQALRNLHRLGAGPWPYYASAVYLIGVLVFTVALAVDFLPEGALPEDVADMTGLVAFLIGSILFAMGGAAECVENKVFSSCQWDQGYFGALLNLFGGLGFVAGAIFGFVEGQFMTSMFLYGVGSSIYALGSAVMIVMWKDEQFGLTFLAVLNQLGGPNGRPVVRTEKGGVGEENTFSMRGALFIMVYVLTGVLSVYDTLISMHDIMDPNAERGRVLERSFNALLPCVFAHFMLALNSGVYKTPALAPFHQLYIGCRYIAVCMCINNTARFVQALMDENRKYEVRMAAHGLASIQP